MGNLDLNKVYAWTPDDYKVSKVMQEYFANFIKTGESERQGAVRLAEVWRGTADRH